MTETLFFSDNHPNSKYIRNELIKNLTKTNECNLSNIEELFFSDENIDLINKKLILSVWKQTKNTCKINYQSKDKLIIVMRYIYIEYGKNLPFDIKKQIDELNCITVGEILPNILTNIDQHFGYLRDIEIRQALPNLPINSRIDKNLPSAYFNNQ